MAELKEEIEELKENGASESDIVQALGLTDAFHLTPLHYAVKYQHVDIVLFILKNGAGRPSKFASFCKVDEAMLLLASYL